MTHLTRRPLTVEDADVCIDEISHARDDARRHHNEQLVAELDELLGDACCARCDLARLLPEQRDA